MSKKKKKRSASSGRSPQNTSPQKASQSARRRSGTKLWTAIIIVAVLVGGIIAWHYWSQPALGRLSSLHVKGAKNAPVQIREFADYG